MLQHHIRQGLNTLGSDFTLFVVDLLGLLVAEQEYDCAEQEDGGAPANAVRPPELPHLSVACNTNTGSTTRIQPITNSGTVSWDKTSGAAYGHLWIRRLLERK